MIFAFFDAFGVPPASWMKNHSAGRPEARTTSAIFSGLRVFAAQADGENRADVGMPAEREHEADGVRIVVAAGKADDMGVRFIAGDGVGDELGALNGVDYERDVADPLFAVGAEEGGPDCGGRGHEALQGLSGIENDRRIHSIEKALVGHVLQTSWLTQALSMTFQSSSLGSGIFLQGQADLLIFRV